MTLGEKLTQARKAAGLTQADVAAKLNVSRQAVSRWESGQSKPSTERLLALGELYSVSIDQLLNTGNVEDPATEEVFALPESAPAEIALPEKRRPRAWLKYAAAALCGALLMLAITLVLKKSSFSGELSPIQLDSLEQDDSSNPLNRGSGFDFEWE